MSSPAFSSSVNATVEAREVVFNIEMVSLPVGGMITRIAWGSTTLRMIFSRRMPRACAASFWPSSTDRIPARTISDMYAASFRPRPRMAATNVVTRLLTSQVMNIGPKGIPSEMSPIRALMLNQKISCTSTGVPRKNQM